jgi:hypothetical protein
MYVQHKIATMNMNVNMNTNIIMNEMKGIAKERGGEGHISTCHKRRGPQH